MSKDENSLEMLSTDQAYREMWQHCLDRIKTQTTEEEFVKWFEPIVPLEFDGTTLRLRCVKNCSVIQYDK